MPNNQLIKRSWKPQMRTIPIRFTATDMEALRILKDCLGTPDTTRTVRAALGAAVSMVQGLMNQQGFTSSTEFRSWWAAQQAAAQRAQQPGGNTDVAAPSTEPDDGTGTDASAQRPGPGGATTDGDNTNQDVSEGSAIPGSGGGL